ncbi:glycine betaine/proline transport system permease protein [Rhodoligotrophos appendicifer]|uniref:choline ABC transporter permease subunit n=1 Tax=Rhodoligotrophos appendicifer TaxID=987056 RepID=UPI0011856AF1|nr:choline ABC transporter permease subunit [Rhodoligotrophos appendicifer]
MDWLTDQITDHKIPIGQWGKAFFDLLTTYLYWFFDGISLGIENSLEAVIDGMLWIPPLILVALIVALSFLLHRNWKLSIGVALGLLFIINQGYWDETIQTLALVLGATFVSLAIGIPVGIAAAHRPWLFQAIRPILDLMQTLPTFVYLIPALVLFGLGLAPGLIATVIFAIAAPIRLTHLGVTSVPRTLIEAGEAFGATKQQLLWKVELPHAMPTIMAGLTQCIMLSLSMVVIAALVGADGLGKPVVRALNSVNVPMGLESGLAIVIVAIVLDRMFRSETTSWGGK